jgi:transposase
VVERTVARHKDCVTAAQTVQTDDDVSTGEADRADSRVSAQLSPPAGPSDRTDRWAVRARERHAAVYALLTEGVGINAICRRLGLARGTVRRFARAATVEELLVHNGTGRRRSLLEEFKPYLHRRWNNGVTNATQLLDEIKARGYSGSYAILRDYLRTFRTVGPIRQPSPAPPSVRRVTGWIMTDPQNMDPDDHQQLDEILARSPHLTRLAEYVRSFATIMRHLRGNELEAWMTTVDADDLPALRSFVVGIQRDQDAVTAGLTLPWNSGPVEGHVNRIKMIKRQMYGRAKPDLLRKRILLTG